MHVPVDEAGKHEPAARVEALERIPRGARATARARSERGDGSILDQQVAALECASGVHTHEETVVNENTAQAGASLRPSGGGIRAGADSTRSRERSRPHAIQAVTACGGCRLSTPNQTTTPVSGGG